MKYIESLQENMHISGVYLCRTKAVLTNRNGKEYVTLTLQDRTGTADAKIWDPDSPGIGDFDAPAYIAIEADTTLFNGNLQINIRRARAAQPDEYIPSDYLPTSARDIDEMYEELLALADTVTEPGFARLLDMLFREDTELIRAFRFSSAAKSVHHCFVGGLLEHTLSVANLCDYYCSTYPTLNRDLLITAALCHDIGKVHELSPYPENNYTDDGQLLGHIVIGCEMIAARLASIPELSPRKAAELRHCILAHHGEYEYGSPKKPALMEAMALNLADNTDARMETFRSALAAAGTGSGWLGFNRFLDSNIRKTTE